MNHFSKYPQLENFLGLTPPPIDTKNEGDQGTSRILFRILASEVKDETPIRIQTMGEYTDRIFAALGIPKGTIKGRITEAGLSPDMHNFPEDVLGIDSRMITISTTAMVKLAEHIEGLAPIKRGSAAELIFRLAKERSTGPKTIEILHTHHQRVCEALDLPIN